MADELAKGLLFVEGKDDCHALVHLLARNSIVLDQADGPVLIKDKGSDSQVIDSITLAVKSSGKDPVGFVIDSDVTVENRWKQIRPKLEAVDVALPTPALLWSDEVTASGFISRSSRFERKVGVWIMPNNRMDYGKIEDLLRTLVPQGDGLYSLAERSTAEAIGLSIQRPPDSRAIQSHDAPKGKLHAWLAWQEEPGLSYGHALRKKYFEGMSEPAKAFVDWFRRLYGIG